jgi:hypothetical protein
MDIEIRNQRKQNRLIKYAEILFLIGLMVLFMTFFNSINNWLVNVDMNSLFVSLKWWTIFVKIFLYCIHILFNFLILWAITQNKQYSIYLLYIAIGVLFIGVISDGLRVFANIHIPMTLLAFFVKMNKTPVLLILFVAGFIVKNRIGAFEDDKTKKPSF